MRLPSHIAIIMDGNGRWAQMRKRPRQFGHIRGARQAREAIEECSRRGIGYLTLFAFSTENWARPQDEISLLMRLLQRHLRRERATLIKNNIKFKTIGRIEKLPIFVQTEIHQTIEATKGNTGMVLTFALNYGGKQDLTAATKKVAELIMTGQLIPENVSEDLLASHLETSGLPDPDLIIRTSGENRISNFMLWQAAYSELYITPVLWPDFDTNELGKALADYSSRDRRFGKAKSASVEAPL